MSTAQIPSRRQLAELVNRKTNFKLNLVSIGCTVETEYQFMTHLVGIGAIMGVMGPGSCWLDIGQVTQILQRDGSGFARFSVRLIERESEQGNTPNNIIIPSPHLVCRLKVWNDNG